MNEVSKLPHFVLKTLNQTTMAFILESGAALYKNGLGSECPSISNLDLRKNPSPKALDLEFGAESTALYENGFGADNLAEKEDSVQTDKKENDSFQTEDDKGEEEGQLTEKKNPGKLPGSEYVLGDDSHNLTSKLAFEAAWVAAFSILSGFAAIDRMTSLDVWRFDEYGLMVISIAGLLLSVCSFSVAHKVKKAKWKQLVRCFIFANYFGFDTICLCLGYLKVK